LRRMEHVEKHPDSGVYRVRVIYPAHLRGILGQGSFTKSLNTRDAAAARKAAIPVLAEVQKRIADAQATYDRGSGQPLPKPIPTIHEGLRFIQQWKEEYLAKRLDDLNLNIRIPEPGDYFIAYTSTPEEADKLFQPGNLDAFFEYIFQGDTEKNLLNRTLDRILRDFGYALPEKHIVRTGLNPSILA
jgi:hypothetical protein